MEISEDIQRELVYGLNARLLGALPGAPDGTELAATLLAVLRDEGPRYHEPDLIAEWCAAVGAADLDELCELLEESLQAIVEELLDSEEPFSAHQVLTLLAEESFWVATFGSSGGQVALPARASVGVALPLSLRAGIVAVLDHLEVTLHDARLELRSVHDQLDRRFVDRWVDQAVQAIDELGLALRVPDLLERLRSAPPGLHPQLGNARHRPSLRRALGEVQRWKLSVEFDACPDEDDGEWTLRVLERLYDLSWVPTT